jgi:hypothetical protein
MSHNQVGPEARYLSRFSKIKQQSGESIKNIDSAGNVTQHLTEARASLRAQEANTKALFATAKEMIAGIDTTQQMLGHTFVKNMPQPTKEINESMGKQLGYVQLSMRFLQAGVVHFMEQMSDATDRIEHMEKVIKSFADYDEEVQILGDLQSLDLDSLEQRAEPELKDIAQSITTPATPPQSPTTDAKQKTPKSSSSHQKRK